VDPNRLGQPHGGSVPRHPRAMDVEGIVAEPPWLLQGAALWALSGLVSGRTQSNGMNIKSRFAGTRSQARRPSFGSDYLTEHHFYPSLPFKSCAA
jgi:hypothetical protein